MLNYVHLQALHGRINSNAQISLSSTKDLNEGYASLQIIKIFSRCPWACVFLNKSQMDDIGVKGRHP